MTQQAPSFGHYVTQGTQSHSNGFPNIQSRNNSFPTIQGSHSTNSLPNVVGISLQQVKIGQQDASKF